VASYTLGLSGVYDVVEFTQSPEGVRLPEREGLYLPAPVEYKRGQPKRDPCDEAQLRAQAICLEEMLSVDIPQGYLKVLKVLKGMIKLSHPGHLVTLAMMIAGIVVSRNARLTSVSAETATKAKDKSNEMWLRRWGKHAGVDADAICLPFARQILEALSNAPYE
jgi:hypothetical protein